MEHLGIDVGTDRGGQLWLRLKIRGIKTLGPTDLDFQVTPVLRVWTVPNLASLRVVLRAELVENAMEPAGLVLRRFRKALVANVRNREELADIDAREF